MQFVKIWLLCIVAAIGYGILHDEVTAHICVEYFSIAHPMILALNSPTLLALEWGILATWWVGAALGFGLAGSARWGSRPRFTAQALRRPILFLLAWMAIAATFSGLTGYWLARTQRIVLSGWFATAIPTSAHARFLADSWAHAASYLVGGVGGIFLCARTYAKRSGLL